MQRHPTQICRRRQLRRMEDTRRVNDNNELMVCRLPTFLLPVIAQLINKQ